LRANLAFAPGAVSLLIGVPATAPPPLVLLVFAAALALDASPASATVASNVMATAVATRSAQRIKAVDIGELGPLISRLRG
jgi:hypothetical protein